ncbi:hypothetical protein BKN38_04665 [Helicobacter sp. CLO-3]|uniref:outer membrane beta-barrel protein n=1 Tax=unclassified Helicobacter TaxID=2593540 RepID=UPI00080494CB|nr:MULTISPECIES: outer membrane beta-barrel protein [unclassified Helicobacter]OBV29831.1 hypothetical protein BA723_04160 [Helicobacter sp. CLO-3]OHU83981.1 hypothetical protein BKN38_04665 [Helicobacter sp. CLO-3]
MRQKSTITFYQEPSRAFCQKSCGALKRILRIALVSLMISTALYAKKDSAESTPESATISQSAPATQSAPAAQNTPTYQNAPANAPALQADSLLLEESLLDPIKGKRLDVKEILRAQSQNTKGKSLDEKILHYENLLRVNGITPHKESEYIEHRFADKDDAAKQDLSRYYTLADKKSGAFASISIGFGNISQTYTDGLYNRTNNVPADDKDSTSCNETDKSGCKITGVFINGAQGIAVESDVFAFGGGFGYQKFFNPYFGSRLYGDGLLSAGSETIGGEKVGSFYYVLGGMNVDLLGELPFGVFTKSRFWEKFAVGGYFGLNIGVMLLFDESNENLSKYLINPGVRQYTSKDVLWNYQLQVDYGLNMGFSISFTHKYKLDIGAKVPMSLIGLPSELRLGLESPARYDGAYIKRENDGRERVVEDSQTLVSKDITFTRSPIFTISFIQLF